MMLKFLREWVAIAFIQANAFWFLLCARLDCVQSRTSDDERFFERRPDLQGGTGEMGFVTHIEASMSPYSCLY